MIDTTSVFAATRFGCNVHQIVGTVNAPRLSYPMRGAVGATSSPCPHLGTSHLSHPPRRGSATIARTPRRAFSAPSTDTPPHASLRSQPGRRPSPSPAGVYAGILRDRRCGLCGLCASRTPCRRYVRHGGTSSFWDPKRRWYTRVLDRTGPNSTRRVRASIGPG